MKHNILTTKLAIQYTWRKTSVNTLKRSIVDIKTKSRKLGNSNNVVFPQTLLIMKLIVNSSGIIPNTGPPREGPVFALGVDLSEDQKH